MSAAATTTYPQEGPMQVAYASDFGTVYVSRDAFAQGPGFDRFVLVTASDWARSAVRFGDWAGATHYANLLANHLGT